MPSLPRFRREAPHLDDGGVGVVIITGSCCIPGMRPFDEEARRVVEQAIAETGVSADLKELPASNALFGGASKKVLADLLAMNNEGGRIGLPAVLVNGEAISYGVPGVEIVATALLRAAGRIAPDATTAEGPVAAARKTEHAHG